MKLQASTEVTTRSIAEASQHVDFIDGLRGLAVLMVIVFHSSIHTHNPYRFESTAHYAEMFSGGVSLFFILSAFTLFQASYARRETNFRSAFIFYARRMLRILPLWWAVCLFYAIFMRRTFGDAALSMSFAVGFFKDAYLRCVSPVGWTLFVEESFYLFFPLWIGLITSTWRAALALAVVFWLRGYYVPATAAAPGFHPDFLTLALANYYMFFAGILIWFISREKLFVRVAETSAVRWLLDALALSAFIAAFFVSWDTRSLSWSTILLAASARGTLTRKVASVRVLTLTGGLCYGIYLLHHLVEHYVTQTAQYQLRARTSGEAEFVFAFILTSIVTTAIAWFVFNYFERPIVQRGRQWLVSFRSK